MAHRLECATSFKTTAATAADIDRLFADDALRGEFIILTAPDGSFIQAMFEASEPVALEYVFNQNAAHDQVDGELSKEDARKVFQQFLSGDLGWKKKYRWTPMEKSSGCLFYILLFSILTAAFTR